MLILKQLAICSSTYFISKSKKLLAKGFTHVVALSGTIPKPLLLQFENIQIKLKMSETVLNLLEFSPKIMDFLRAAKLVNGKVLFVEPDPKQLERLQRNHTDMLESKR
jgi:hypothetical protein